MTDQIKSALCLITLVSFIYLYNFIECYLKVRKIRKEKQQQEIEKSMYETFRVRVVHTYVDNNVNGGLRYRFGPVGSILQVSNGYINSARGIQWHRWLEYGKGDTPIERLNDYFGKIRNDETTKFELVKERKPLSEVIQWED